MIDYRIANWINRSPSATQLILANAVNFTQRSWMAVHAMAERLAKQTKRIDRCTRTTQAVSLPLFYPNCYPFRHQEGVAFSRVCASPAGLARD